MPTRRDDLMVWIDCEMTGLDTARHTLIEIATIITDFDLNIIDRGPDLAITISPGKFKAMDPWSRRTHTASGLLERCKTEGVAMASAEKKTLGFIKKYCAARTAPLCGNSVWQDKRFIAQYMPAIERYLHYRIVDVSSIKLMARHWFPNQNPPAKQEAHRALADIEASIAELKFYRSLLARDS
ncbi:MAG TPA: oligoribonuclease [Vicinamibacterales bacterium]|nr:oligoribonuclease [Vicinamibacterales bacterium]